MELVHAMRTPGRSFHVNLAVSRQNDMSRHKKRGSDARARPYQVQVVDVALLDDRDAQLLGHSLALPGHFHLGPRSVVVGTADQQVQLAVGFEGERLALRREQVHLLPALHMCNDIDMSHARISSRDRHPESEKEEIQKKKSGRNRHDSSPARARGHHTGTGRPHCHGQRCGRLRPAHPRGRCDPSTRRRAALGSWLTRASQGFPPAWPRPDSRRT
eukprot:3876476-Rhodomonas_salina.5